MKLLLDMLKKPVFTMEDVKKLYPNESTGRTALWRLQKDGLVEKIRNNLYTCISPESGQPLANKYQIASSITPTSYVSHHSALEFYGVTDQVYYEIYVSSETRFNAFEYDGYNYRFVPSKIAFGIDIPAMKTGIKVTDYERTVLDSIKDMDKIGGMEEIIASLELITELNGTQILKYLKYYQNQFLYQKVGFLLSAYQNQFRLSDSFYEECKNKMGKSKRYLTKDNICSKWIKEWNLVVPNNVFGIKNGELP